MFIASVTLEATQRNSPTNAGQAVRGPDPWTAVASHGIGWLLDSCSAGRARPVTFMPVGSVLLQGEDTTKWLYSGPKQEQHTEQSALHRRLTTSSPDDRVRPAIVRHTAERAL